MNKILPILYLVLLCGCHGTKTITERVEVPVVVTQEHTIERAHRPCA